MYQNRILKIQSTYAVPYGMDPLDKESGSGTGNLSPPHLDDLLELELKKPEKKTENGDGNFGLTKLDILTAKEQLKDKKQILKDSRYSSRHDVSIIRQWPKPDPTLPIDFPQKWKRGLEKPHGGPITHYLERVFYNCMSLEISLKDHVEEVTQVYRKRISRLRVCCAIVCLFQTTHKLLPKTVAEKIGALGLLIGVLRTVDLKVGETVPFDNFIHRLLKNSFDPEIDFIKSMIRGETRVGTGECRCPTLKEQLESANEPREHSYTLLTQSEKNVVKYLMCESISLDIDVDFSLWEIPLKEVLSKRESLPPLKQEPAFISVGELNRLEEKLSFHLEGLYDDPEDEPVRKVSESEGDSDTDESRSVWSSDSETENTSEYYDADTSSLEGDKEIPPPRHGVEVDPMEGDPSRGRFPKDIHPEVEKILMSLAEEKFIVIPPFSLDEEDGEGDDDDPDEDEDELNKLEAVDEDLTLSEDESETKTEDLVLDQAPQPPAEEEKEEENENDDEMDPSMPLWIFPNDILGPLIYDTPYGRNPDKKIREKEDLAARERMQRRALDAAQRARYEEDSSGDSEWETTDDDDDGSAEEDHKGKEKTKGVNDPDDDDEDESESESEESGSGSETSSPKCDIKESSGKLFVNAADRLFSDINPGLENLITPGTKEEEEAIKEYHEMLELQRLAIDNKEDSAEEEEINEEVRQILKCASTEALSVNQRQIVMSEIQNSKQVAKRLGLMPVEFPDLVENNPLVAVDIILKMVNTKDFDGFLQVLLNMKMSVHSMEVVNRLTSTIDVPSEFLHLFISNCISTCEGIPDKYMQNRLVRLVCVFLQSLIRNRSINLQELYIEILPFCLEFSRIREATALYRLVKQVESEDSGGPHAAAAKKLDENPTNANAVPTDSATTKNLSSISKDLDPK